MSLQSCYLIPTVVKRTRVRSTSATLIDNIFVNTPEKVLVSGNIISDGSDHFSQFCILASVNLLHFLLTLSQLTYLKLIRMKFSREKLPILIEYSISTHPLKPYLKEK